MPITEPTIVRITPDPDCKNCLGTGIVYDIVDYGSTTARLSSFCNCVEAQIGDELMDEDIEIELVFP
jgi:hypothetical protein